MLSGVLQKDFNSITQILSKHVPEYEVYAFGSRVTGNNREASDLDIVIMNDQLLTPIRQAELREAFSESDIPFKVDVVEWASTKEDFRKIISQNRIKIQKAKTEFIF